MIPNIKKLNEYKFFLNFFSLLFFGQIYLELLIAVQRECLPEPNLAVAQNISLSKPLKKV